MMVFEDKLDLTKMNVNDGAVLKADVFTQIAEYQVTPGEIARFWGYTEEVSATQVLMGQLKATIQDATPAALDDNAVIRLVVKNASKSKTVEVFRAKYADVKNGVSLPLKKPGAQPYSYLAIEVMLPSGAASFTFSKANSTLDVSTTVVQE